MALSHSFSVLLVLTLLVLSSAEYENGGFKYNPKPHYELNPKPKQEMENLLSTTIAIQGMVYCKSGRAKPYPLEGAVVRITCLALDKYGFERSPFSFLSEATNENGYFFSTLCSSEIPKDKYSKITKCKAFLELSPEETCDVQTDINKGISGAILSSPQLLMKKNMKLFTVGPFFYTNDQPPKSIPSNNGY